MRLNKLFYILLTCILTLGLAACSDDDNDGTDPKPTNPENNTLYLYSQIEGDWGENKQFVVSFKTEYDDQARITKITYPSESDKNPDRYSNYKYDTDGKLISYESNEHDYRGYIGQFTYSDKKVEIISTHSGSKHREVLTLDDKDRLIKKETYLNDEIAETITITYDDKKLTATVRKSGSNEYTITSYEKKNGFASDVNMPQWFFACLEYYYPQYEEIERIVFEGESARYKTTYTSKFEDLGNGKEYPIERKQEEFDVATSKIVETLNYKISYKELKK